MTSERKCDIIDKRSKRDLKSPSAETWYEASENSFIYNSQSESRVRKAQECEAFL